MRQRQLLTLCPDGVAPQVEDRYIHHAVAVEPQHPPGLGLIVQNHQEQCVGLTAVVGARRADHRPGDVDAHQQIGFHPFFGAVQDAVVGDRFRVFPVSIAAGTGRKGLVFPAADQEGSRRQNNQQQRSGDPRPARVAPVDAAVMVIRAVVMLMSHVFYLLHSHPRTAAPAFSSICFKKSSPNFLLTTARPFARLGGRVVRL